MSGLVVLSEEEKQEMLKDARNIERGKGFFAARLKSQEGSIDEYIDFLSQNIELIDFVPSKQITIKYKL